jgi:hypothetical protein
MRVAANVDVGTRQWQSGRNGRTRLGHAVAIAAASLLFCGCAAPIEGGKPQGDLGFVIQSIVGKAASNVDQDIVVMLARFDVEPASSGGCSAGSERIPGSVEHALGILFGILLLIRMRSARRHCEADQRNSDIQNGRLPYRDLGMRESLASFSDDR